MKYMLSHYRALQNNIPEVFLIPIYTCLFIMFECSPNDRELTNILFVRNRSFIWSLLQDNNLKIS